MPPDSEAGALASGQDKDAILCTLLGHTDASPLERIELFVCKIRHGGRRPKKNGIEIGTLARTIFTYFLHPKKQPLSSLFVLPGRVRRKLSRNLAFAGDEQTSIASQTLDGAPKTPVTKSLVRHSIKKRRGWDVRDGARRYIYLRREYVAGFHKINKRSDHS